MPSNESDLRALWRDQPATTLRMTPEQLRARAEKFVSQTRRRYWRDQASAALVALAFAYGAFTLEGGLVRLGSAMLLIWALYAMYGLRRFGSPLPDSPEMGAQTCAAYHQRQLERQRDIVLSWPLGIGLAVPGFVLFAVGFPLGPKPLPWPPAVALAGMFAFACLATVIYGKVLAGQWQREIDVLARDTSNER